MKESIRLFVAATLPAHIKEYIAQQLHHFEAPAVRVVPEQNLHLTLFFIGETSRERLPDIKQKVQEVAQKHAPFTLELESLEPGPKPKSPRLVWARFNQADVFEQLSQDLTQALAEQPPKQKEAIPHVTLARFKKDMQAPKHLPTIVPEDDIRMPVETISIWQSELASPHPVYTVLETYPLGDNQ